MKLFKFYNKAKNHLNKTYFTEKHVISFKAYNLLKKYVVKGLSGQNSLDKAYPKNLRMNVLKNVSRRSMKTFYNLADRYEKNSNGVLCQTNNFEVKKNLSKKSRALLNKINNDEPRYEEIDSLIKKHKSI